MKELVDVFTNTNTLHHAYVCIGESEALHTELEVFLTGTLGFSVRGNPEYSVIMEPTFSVDSARLLAENQAQKSFDGSKKIFVVRTQVMGEEAQNALLKIFEEPAENTHFFILMPQDTLLPTLRSRVVVLRQSEIYEAAGESKKENSAKTLASQSLPERLALIKKMTDDISDEKKTKQDALEFINTLEAGFYADGGVVKHTRELGLCEAARTALFDRGSMTKMILENLMLQLE